MKNLTILLVCMLIFTVTGYSQTRYYASNRALNAVNSYQEDGTFIEEFIAQDAGGLSSPQDIIVHPDGYLLVTGTFNERILKFDLETGAFLGEWSDPSFALGRPSKMSLGPDNLIYVTQWGQTAPTAKVVRYDLDGNYLGPFTPIAPTGLGHVWDGEGNFYLAVFGVATNEGDIRKYDPDGNFIETFIDSTILENPTYIWWDSNGDMLVQDFTAGKVLRYDSDGNYLNEFITGLNQPEGYTYLPNGNLLISERGANRVSEFDENGTLVGRWDNGGVLASPNFIEAIDPSVLHIEEQNENTTIVTPSIGNIFSIITSESSELSQLEIYDTLGKLVKTLQLENSTNWNATYFSEGIYMIVATFADGKKSTQKIIVKH